MPEGLPIRRPVRTDIGRSGKPLGNPDTFSARWATLLGRPATTGLVSFRIGHPERTAGLSLTSPPNDHSSVFFAIAAVTAAGHRDSARLGHRGCST